MLRRQFTSPYIANNGYTLEMAFEARSSGSADVISFGRSFIANPDLVERFRQGLPLTIADRDTYYGGAERGYTDWSTA